MLTIFLEQFWTVALVGTILTALTIYGWLQTGNSNALKVAIALAVLTLILVSINFVVVTDGEVVRQQIYEMASELEQNQRAQIRSRIHPFPSERVRSLAAQMETIEFSSVRVARIHSIVIKPKRSIPQAVVRLNVVVEGESRMMPGRGLRWVELTLDKMDGRWLLSDLEDRDPQHEYLNSTHLERLGNQ